MDIPIISSRDPLSVKAIKQMESIENPEDDMEALKWANEKIKLKGKINKMTTHANAILQYERSNTTVKL